MVRAKQPAIEQRHHPMDKRRQLGRRLGLAVEKRRAMFVAMPAQGLIAEPLIRVNDAARNSVVNGIRVSWKIMPAVTEV
jgi:hypothetical protein